MCNLDDRHADTAVGGILDHYVARLELLKRLWSILMIFDNNGKVNLEHLVGRACVDADSGRKCQRYIGRKHL